MQRIYSSLIIALCTAAFSNTRAAAGPLSPNTVRDAVGINIHFTEPRPGEMDLLAGTGVGRVRMDIAWKKIETTKGVYDFSRFDRLMSALDAKHLSPLLVLDYGNELYSPSDKIAPTDPQARHAFAAWAAATVAHFRGRGILWELYNEPNNKEFWTPRPDGAAYATLANDACRAIHKVAPDELAIGPALALIDRPFLIEAIDGGILNSFAAISVHPYRKTAPETFGADLRVLRSMIDARAPIGKTLPIVAGEWGYPDVWVDAKTQVNYLAREMLFNLSQQVPLTIWYDWRRGGTYEGKHDIYGLIKASADQNGRFVLNKTPLYQALAALTRTLGETHFSERVESPNAEDYILAFDGPAGRCYAAWTTSAHPHRFSFLKDAGLYQLFDVYGHAKSTSNTDASQDTLLTDSPVYYVPKVNR